MCTVQEACLVDTGCRDTPPPLRTQRQGVFLASTSITNIRVRTVSILTKLFIQIRDCEYLLVLQGRINNNYEMRTNKKIIPQLTDFALKSVLRGLIDDCTPEASLGEGAFGQVYGGTFKKLSVLKVWNSDQINTQPIHKIMSVLYLNPSGHTVNIHQIKEKKGRLWVVLEKCDQTLDKYLNKHHKQELQQRLKIIDQILRGLIHLHTIGIIVGKLTMENIYMLDIDRTKLVKIAINSQSKYFEDVNVKQSSESYTNGALYDDLKQVVKIIVELIWSESLTLTSTTYSPQNSSNPLKISNQDSTKLLNLINLALNNGITAFKFHKQFQSIYKAQPEQELFDSQSKIAGDSSEITKADLVLASAEDYLFLRADKRMDKSEAEEMFLKKFEKDQAAIEFMNALEDLYSDEMNR